MTYLIGFRSDIVVTGYDPEMADMSNPQGARYAEAFFAIAQDPKGYRKEWSGGLHRTEAEARRAYALFAPPVELWADAPPAYGSRAYVESDEEANVVAWEKEVDSWMPQHVVGLSRR